MGGGKSKSKSKSKSKTRTKAQRMAVSNKAKYGGTAKAAAANRAASRTAAGNRYAASQAAKSDKAMSKAGVSGVGPVASGRTYATALKNTTQGIGPVSSGSTYARSLEAEKKQQESARAAETARKAEAARVKAAEEKRVRMFTPERLTGGALSQTGAKLADTFAKPQFMYQGNPFGRAPGLSNYFSPDAGAAATYSRSGALKGIPFAGGDAAGSLTRYKVPTGAQLSRSPLGIRQFKLSPDQMKNIGLGISGAGDDVAGIAAKGGVKALGKFGARAIPFVGAGLSLADSFNRVRTGDYGGAALAAASAIPGPVGLTALGGLAAKDISQAVNAGGTETASAGGLNIGSAPTTDSGEGKPSGLGRVIGGVADAVMRDTTDFDKRGVGNPASFGLENTVAGSVLNAAAQETGTINQFRKDTDNFSNLQNFNSLSNDEKVKTAQNVLKFTNDSQAAQALGEGLGLGKDFKTKINSAVDNVQGRLEGVTADRNSLYGVTSDFARDIGTDPDLNPINKFLTATATDNLGEAGKEKNILGMTNEMARDIKAAFQDDSPTTRGLSAEQRGIVGSVGNRLLSGKATDGLREATYGYGGREGATNAGLTEGQPLNFSDIQNTALAMRDNLGTGTTLASQRFDEAKRLTSPGGVTAGSLIRGSIPRFGGRTGSSGSTAPIRGTGTTTPEELLLPETPTYTAPTQTGTDTSNLQQIQQQSYMQNLAQLGITNLRQLPQFRTQQQRAPRRFRSFRRDYF